MSPNVQSSSSRMFASSMNPIPSSSSSSKSQARVLNLLSRLFDLQASGVGQAHNPFKFSHVLSSSFFTLKLSRLKTKISSKIYQNPRLKLVPVVFEVGHFFIPLMFLFMSCLPIFPTSRLCIYRFRSELLVIYCVWMSFCELTLGR